MKKKLGLLLALAMGVMIAVTGCGKEKLDMNDYIYCDYSEDGTIISTTVLEDGFYLMLGAIANDPQLPYNEEVQVVATDIFAEVCDGTYDKSVGLSNGDEIEYHWEISEDNIKKFESLTGVKIKQSGSKKITVCLD